MTTNNIGLHYQDFGQPLNALQLITQPYPDALQDGQVIVAMLETPINPSDLIPVTGAYRHRITLPAIAGYEGVGIVVDSQDKSANHLIDKRVLPLRGQGTWQKYVICDANLVIPVPDDIPNHIAARAYINPLTAYLLLQQSSVYHQEVVITAAGSQCGQLLCNMANRQGAKKIYGMTATNTHHNLLEQAGVTPLLENAPDTLQRIQHATHIYDAVGGKLADTLLLNARPNTRFYSYGLLSGQPITAYSSIQPIRFHLRDAIAQASLDCWQQWFRALWPMLKEITFPTPQIFPYQQWQQAIHAFYQRDRNFKPLLSWTD